MKFTISTYDEVTETLEGILKYAPATEKFPYWTVWFGDNKSCAFYNHDNVTRVTVVEEEGDEKSASITQLDAQSAVQI